MSNFHYISRRLVLYRWTHARAAIRLVFPAIAAAVGLGIGVANAAVGDLYALGVPSGSDGNSVMRLYQLDKTNASSSLVVSTGIVGLRGLAIDPKTGKFYSAYGSKIHTTSRGIVEIDPDTGAVTDIGGTLAIVSLAFDSSGQLYVGARETDTTVSVYQVSKENGAETFVGRVGSRAGGGPSIAFDSSSNILFQHFYLGDLNTVDISSGVFTYSGRVELPWEFSHSFDFDENGNVFYAEWPNPDEGTGLAFASSDDIFSSSLLGTTGIHVRGLAYQLFDDSLDIEADLPFISVNEGDAASNTGTVSDEAVLDATTGNVINNGDGTWSWSLATVDGPGDSGQVTVSAVDGAAEGSVSFDLVVNNVPPQNLLLTGPAGLLTLEDSASVEVTFTDPGVNDTHTITWEWGDVSTDTVNAGDPIPSHQYATTGRYDVTVTVTDKDGDSTAAVLELDILSARNLIERVEQQLEVLRADGATRVERHTARKAMKKLARARSDRRWRDGGEQLKDRQGAKVLNRVCFAAAILAQQPTEATLPLAEALRDTVRLLAVLRMDEAGLSIDGDSRAAFLLTRGDGRWRLAAACADYRRAWSSALGRN